MQLESLEFIEHTGNEAQEGFDKYFTGAMVISMKKAKPAAAASKKASVKVKSKAGSKITKAK